MDLGDLRSALKFFLEEFGYKVKLSEYNDFNVDPTKSTYEACLKQIEDCEYFILLIGYRRGGWYKKDEISITQKEYRYARKLQEKGKKIKIISFVRNEIWTVRTDRESMIKHFKERGKELREILKIPSNILQDDPEFIFNFIDEVARRSEMISAIREGTDFPINNWIYSFYNFKEIIKALETTLRLKTNRRKELLRTLAKYELEENLKILFESSIGSRRIYPIYYYVQGFMQHFNFVEIAQRAANQGEDLSIDIPASALRYIRQLFFFVGGLKKFKIDNLRELVFSGEYLKYNVDRGCYEISKFMRLIETIFKEIKRIQHIISPSNIFYDEAFREAFEIAPRISQYRDEQNIRISYKLLTVCWAVGNLENLHKLLVIAIKHLEGETQPLEELNDSEFQILAMSGEPIEELDIEDVRGWENQ